MARYKALVLFIKLIYKIFISVIVDLASFKVNIIFGTRAGILEFLQVLHCFSNIFTC